jgi:hypothetical protein
MQNAHSLKQPQTNLWKKNDHRRYMILGTWTLISLIHKHHIYIHICEEAKYVNLPVSLKNPLRYCFAPPIPPKLPLPPALPAVVPAQVAVSSSIRVCCPNWVWHPAMTICTFVHIYEANSSHICYTAYRVMIPTCMHTYIHTYIHTWYSHTYIRHAYKHT